MASPMALAVEELVAGYEADVPIVNRASLAVAAGEIVALLGPNGAGKSTLVKAVAGLVPIASGRVLLGGDDIAHRPTHELVRAGLAFVPQTDNVFTRLSVDDNLRLAVAVLARCKRSARLEAGYALFPDLRRQRRLPAGGLSGGQRQMLAIARALVSSPRALMLDEPSAGLSPKMVGEVFTKLAEIRDTGVGILLVEQNVKAALGLADRLCVLVGGVNRLDGRPAELARSPELASLYLGSGHAAGRAAGGT